MKGVIYVGHGSRVTSSNEKFITFIKKVVEKVEAPLQEYAFLENGHPSIGEAVDTCVSCGATEIAVMPILLLPGVHANEDIPAEIQAAKLRHPSVAFRYGRTLGAERELAQLIMERLRLCGYGARENESVLLVGHGSRDPGAAVEFESLARMLHGDIKIGYLKQSPYFEEVIADCKEKVYIFPHLLFWRRLNVEGEDVIVCEPLGLDDKMVDLVVRRVGLM